GTFRYSTAKNMITGSEKMNSRPLEPTVFSTQISRGMFVDRTSRLSWTRARVVSVTVPLNHCQGSSPSTRNRMYGSSPAALRTKTWVKTNQYTKVISNGSSTVQT